MEQEKPTESSEKSQKVELPRVTTSLLDFQEYLPYYLGVTVFIGVIFALGVLVGHYFRETLYLLQQYFYCLASAFTPIALIAASIFAYFRCFYFIRRIL
jgi:type II secretory pathway component PulF